MAVITGRKRLAQVGRVGELRLEYCQQDGKTIITRSSCSSPWHLLPPIYLDDTGQAHTLLLNPSGGLVGGDRLSIDMTLAPEAQVLISTPSANRVYRSPSEVSVQLIDLTVGHGAVLEWIPEVTIPFAGSRFRQALHVKVEDGATVILWDAIAAGRIARGERWAFTSLENEVRITTSSRAVVLERYHLIPGPKREGIGLAEEWNYVASFYAISEIVEEEQWKRLEENLGEIVDGCRDRVFAGVSEPSVQGRIVRLLTRSAPDLHAILQKIWTAARAQLLGLPVPALRRY